MIEAAKTSRLEATPSVAKSPYTAVKVVEVNGLKDAIN